MPTDHRIYQFSVIPRDGSSSAVLSRNKIEATISIPAILRPRDKNDIEICTTTKISVFEVHIENEIPYMSPIGCVLRFRVKEQDDAHWLLLECAAVGEGGAPHGNWSTVAMGGWVVLPARVREMVKVDVPMVAPSQYYPAGADLEITLKKEEACTCQHKKGSEHILYVQSKRHNSFPAFELR